MWSQPFTNLACTYRIRHMDRPLRWGLDKPVQLGEQCIRERSKHTLGPWRTEPLSRLQLWLYIATRLLLERRRLLSPLQLSLWTTDVIRPCIDPHDFLALTNSITIPNSVTMDILNAINGNKMNQCLDVWVLLLTFFIIRYSESDSIQCDWCSHFLKLCVKTGDATITNCTFSR